jgi:hypothetical protein
MPQERRLTPGYVVYYPNREKAASKATKGIVVLILLVSVAIMLLITIGGWSKLQGMKPVNFAWCIVYLLIAYFVTRRWARGLLPIAAAMAIMLLGVSLISGLGVAGTSWFDRNHTGFAAPQTPFGGHGFGPDLLGLLTLLLAPVQVLLILFATQGFAQGWNVELEVPKEEAERRRRGGGSPSKSGSSAAVTA